MSPTFWSNEILLVQIKTLLQRWLKAGFQNPQEASPYQIDSFIVQGFVWF